MKLKIVKCGTRAKRSKAQPIIDACAIRRMGPLKAKLQQRAVNAVLQGTAWMTSAQVGSLTRPNERNIHAAATRLLSDGRIFAIEHHGQKRYPSYAFDPLGNPIPELRTVLKILHGYTPFRLASWFESTSSRLGGRRPRDLLSENPQAVIDAAREQVEGLRHG